MEGIFTRCVFVHYYHGHRGNDSSFDQSADCIGCSVPFHIGMLQQERPKSRTVKMSYFGTFPDFTVLNQTEPARLVTTHHPSHLSWWREIIHQQTVCLFFLLHYPQQLQQTPHKETECCALFYFLHHPVSYMDLMTLRSGVCVDQTTLRLNIRGKYS